MKPGDRIHWRGREGILLWVSECGRYGRVAFRRGGQPDGRRAVMMAECELTADRELRKAQEHNARIERIRAERDARLEARYAEVRAAVSECGGESWRIADKLGLCRQSAGKWLRAAGCDWKNPRWVIKKS